jgi:hypothetical protein
MLPMFSHSNYTRCIMMVLCDCLMIGLFRVTRPLKRSWRGGADGTLPRAPCRSGLKRVGREDDTCASQVDMGTTPHKAGDFMWYVGAMDTEKQASSWRPLHEPAASVILGARHGIWFMATDLSEQTTSRSLWGTKMGDTGFILDKDQHRCGLCGT